MKMNLKATIILISLLFLKSNLYAEVDHQRIDKLSKNHYYALGGNEYEH